MKTRIAFISIMMMLFADSLQAQSKQQINHLATFAKVWGFLKYYHPEVAKGNPNWDKEWLKTALTITKVGDNKKFKLFIISWYSSLPQYQLNDKITQPQGDSVMRMFDEHDIRRFNIPAKMKDELVDMYRYHRPDSNKFITNAYGKYTLDYVWHKEETYDEPAYPDEAHRLLALVRYWNIINYFYPHKLISAPNWDKVLTDFIPQFIAAANAEEYRNTFLKLTARLKDSHSFFIHPEFNKVAALNTAFPIYYVDGKYVIGKSQYDLLLDGLQTGDEIVVVNSKPIAQREAELAPVTTGTNKLSYRRNIGQYLFRVDTNRNAQITVKRNGQLISKPIKLYTYTELFQFSIKHQPKQQWQNMGNGVWYVRICSISDVQQLKRMFTDIKDAKIVIWDMRDYPNFQIVQAMGAGLMAQRVKNELNYNGELFYPGVFTAHQDQIPAAPDTLQLPLYKGKLVVLVNEFTQSLAESVSAELRNRPNTIVMGRQTAGTTGNILKVEYPGGIQATYTAVRTEGLNGSFKQGKGVKIDKKIKLTIKKMQSVADYELAQAYKESL